MALKDELLAQITAGKIVFDNNSVELRQQLLQENAGQLISEKLQKLVLFMSRSVTVPIRISSFVRDPSTASHHGKRRAVDIGNEEIASTLLPLLATPGNVALYQIDEIIFDAGGPLPSGPNRWNFNDGQRFNFDDNTLKKHRDHIHISVKA